RLAQPERRGAADREDVSLLRRVGSVGGAVAALDDRPRSREELSRRIDRTPIEAKELPSHETDPRVLAERGERLFGEVHLEDDIRVGEEHERAAREGEADVVRGAEAEVRAELDEARARVLLADELAR